VPLPITGVTWSWSWTGP